MPLAELTFNLPISNAFTYSTEDVVPLGCRAVAAFGNRKLTGWVVGHPDKAPKGVETIKPIDRVVDKQPLFDEKMLKMAQWLAGLYLCSLGEALAAMLPGGRRESSRFPEDVEGDEARRIESLTTEQERAIRGIVDHPGTWNYVYGITGSGKTEVYLQAAEAVLAAGGGAIYLVPEIALSHHLVDGLRSRFPTQIAVIHSGLSPSRRLTEWRRIQSGEARLVLGARSAVFAPVENLGLVIIDEEHEGSYKSGASPRYHARQVAMRRCRETGASLVMGSATPSVEAWNMLKDGRLKELKLSSRPAGGAMPKIRVVDLSREKGLFGRELLEGMNRVLAEGWQVLLFLNRRGFSYQYSCASCSEEIQCRHCSVPLTYHKSKGKMVCHYCGYRSRPPSSCPNCGSLEMRAAGFGTERIEEDILGLFPEKTVARMDADSVRRKGSMETILKDFKSGAIDILLGTQMVAKGFNAPGVKLAGVLSADTSLNLPDFRAAERTFALIVQVAGRAGRFRPDGEVIVQTFRQNAPAVRYAVENRIEEFYTNEIEQRRELGFPPFSRLFRLVIRGQKESAVIEAARSLGAALAGVDAPWEVMGPAECPIGRISRQFRRHIILRSSSFDVSHEALRKVLEVFPKNRDVKLEVDIDPVSLL